MSYNFEVHAVPGLAPAANVFAGTVATDVIKMPGEGILFTLIKGVGATGTTVVTALACDDVTPTTTHAVAFKYRISTTPDVWGDWTEATTTGFTTTAGSNQLYEIWVAAEELAHIGYAYVKLQCVESVANAVAGGILAQLFGGRYKPESDTLIV
jgi:hypothetical protein